LGPAGAARVQRFMTERALAAAAAAAGRRGCGIEICFTGAETGEMAAWLGPGPSYRDQGAGGLGERMERAFARAFAEGRKRAVLVGSDCPQLSASIIRRALEGLRDHELVLGPAADGGYYLIGLTAPRPSLFRAMAWGTDRVLAETMARAEKDGLRSLLLEELKDVDRPEDLDALGHHPLPE
jgi:rSAM/selenodomain-associated transferase 1